MFPLNVTSLTDALVPQCSRALELDSGGRRAVPAALERLELQLEAQRGDFVNVEEIQRRLAADPDLQGECVLHLVTWSRVARTLIKAMVSILRSSITFGIVCN